MTRVFRKTRKPTNPSYLRNDTWWHWLTPEAKRKAAKKRLRKLARDHAKAQRKVKKAKKPKKPRRHWPKFPRPKGVGKILSPVFVKGNHAVNTVYGVPGEHSGSSSTTTLVNDSYTWLMQWNSVKGDFKHAFPFSFRKSQQRYWFGVSRSFDKFGNGSEVSGSNMTGSTLAINPLVFDTSTYNKCLDRLYDKIRGGVDLSIDLAEVHKTKAMMSKTIQGMKTLATTFAKMRRSNPKDWGNLWLEFTYGWKPLASSIYEAGHRALLEPSGPRFMQIEASASRKDGYITDTGNGSTSARVTIAFQNSYFCRMKCRFSFTESALDTLAGFTSLNPVSIAWELTPYSFVVDWFVDVGGYLRNYESALLYGTDFVDGFVSEGWKSEGFGDHHLFSTQPYPQGGFVSQDFFARGKELAFRRAPLGAIPYPRAPRFDPKLGVSRLVSAAALLGQFVDVLAHKKQGKTIPPRLTSADKALAAPKGAASGPYAWFFR